MLDTSYYKSKMVRCWKCKGWTKVYRWKGKQMWDTRKPKEPIPSNVVLTYSKTVGGKYWANTCEKCGAIQGDWFLFMEPDGWFK